MDTFTTSLQGNLLQQKGLIYILYAINFKVFACVLSYFSLV